jgi:hypothetical protein
MKLYKIAVVSILTGLLALGQQPPANKAKPAAAATPASPVDNVIKLLKGGMSEATIIKMLQKQKPYTPTPEEMVKLK